MKRFKILIIPIIFTLFILANMTTSNAASLKIKASKSNAKKGDSVTITVKGSGVVGKIALSASGGSISPSSIWVENSSSTATLKITGSNNVTVKATPVDASDSTSAEPYTKSTSTTIKVASSSNNSSNNNSNNNKNNNTSTSSDATLSNLGIRPNDFTGFRKATTSYTVSVPKNVSTISIYATPSNSKATVTGTGTKTLKEGSNTFSVKVTAEDKKTTKTYTLIINRKAEEVVTNDATLSNLGIRPKQYDFSGFKKMTTSYSTKVPNDVDKVTIYAYPTDEKATVTGAGAQTLKEGTNTCNIKVTAADKKTTKTYTLSITREAKEEEEEQEENADEEQEDNLAGITNIKVGNYTLSPEFKQDVYEYNLTLPKGTTDLDMALETTSDDIETEIAGNEDLKEGKNIITIIARDKKSDSTTTYQITATVGEEQSIDVSEVNKEMTRAQADLDKQGWIIKGTIILIIALIILFLIQRYKIQNEELYEEHEEEYEKEEKNSEVGRFYKDIEQKENEPYNFNLYNEEPTRPKKHRGKRFK